MSNGNKPTTHTITVSATIKDPFPPALSDDEGHSANTQSGDQTFTTLVSPGDIVIWQKGGNISSLDNVFETSGNDLFSSDPVKQNNGTWKGTIGSLASGTEESYSITYSLGGLSHTQDPRLKMR
jgi:hypothetical protein